MINVVVTFTESKKNFADLLSLSSCSIFKSNSFIYVIELDNHIMVKYMQFGHFFATEFQFKNGQIFKVKFEKHYLSI